jgi:hypothetical protein
MVMSLKNQFIKSTTLHLKHQFIFNFQGIFSKELNVFISKDYKNEKKCTTTQGTVSSL